MGLEDRGHGGVMREESRVYEVDLRCLVEESLVP